MERTERMLYRSRGLYLRYPADMPISALFERQLVYRAEYPAGQGCAAYVTLMTSVLIKSGAGQSPVDRQCRRRRRRRRREDRVISFN